MLSSFASTLPFYWISEDKTTAGQRTSHVTSFWSRETWNCIFCWTVIWTIKEQWSLKRRGRIFLFHSFACKTKTMIKGQFFIGFLKHLTAADTATISEKFRQLTTSRESQLMQLAYGAPRAGKSIRANGINHFDADCPVWLKNKKRFNTDFICNSGCLACHGNWRLFLYSLSAPFVSVSYPKRIRHVSQTSCGQR